MASGDGEITALQKGALIMFRLSKGDGMRTCDAQKMLGYKDWKSAHRAMLLIQAKIPYLGQDADGFWCLYPPNEYQ